MKKERQEKKELDTITLCTAKNESKESRNENNQPPRDRGESPITEGMPFTIKFF